MTDFFISYNSADKPWAEWIAWQLEADGHTTVLQAWDFRPGSNFVVKMQEAAVEALRTIAVLSPDYLAARFTQPEWAAAFRQDPTGEQGLLIPVRVAPVEVEGILGPIIYIDLVGMQEEDARRALLDGLAQGRAKPVAQPAFPSSHGSTSDIRTEPDQPVFPGQDHTDRRTAEELTLADRLILFDQAHGQDAWGVPPIIERGYRAFAQLAAQQGAHVRSLTEGPFPAAHQLRQYSAVVLVGAPQGRFQLTERELDDLERYVIGGGGLLAMATYTGDWHHESNLNQLTTRFGLEFGRDLIMPMTATLSPTQDDGRRQVYDFRPESLFTVEAVPTCAESNVMALCENVAKVLTLSSCSVAVRGNAQAVLSSIEESKTFEPLPLGVGVAIDRYEERRTGAAVLVAVATAGAGRVAAVGGWKSFLAEFLTCPGYDNSQLLDNLLRWLTTDK